MVVVSGCAARVGCSGGVAGSGDETMIAAVKNAGRPPKNVWQTPAQSARMNPLLSRLQPYPFERLRQLFAGVTPPAHFSPINLGIGEPRHAAPALLKQALAQALDAGLAAYPATLGLTQIGRASCRERV